MRRVALTLHSALYSALLWSCRGAPVKHAARHALLPSHAELDGPVVCRPVCIIVESFLGTKDPHSRQRCSCVDVKTKRRYRLDADIKDMARYSGKVIVVRLLALTGADAGRHRVLEVHGVVREKAPKTRAARSKASVLHALSGSTACVDKYPTGFSDMATGTPVDCTWLKERAGMCGDDYVQALCPVVRGSHARPRETTPALRGLRPALASTPA